MQLNLEKNTLKFISNFFNQVEIRNFCDFSFILEKLQIFSWTQRDSKFEEHFAYEITEYYSSNLL